MSVHSKLSLMHKMALSILEEEAQGVNDINLLEVVTGIAANLDMAVKATSGREPSLQDQEPAWLAEVKAIKSQVEAVNVYRRRFGCGLREALHAVQGMKDG